MQPLPPSFNWACPSLPSLSNIDFSSICSVARSECGSNGVLFIETKEGSFCVKSSSETLVQEYFSYLLFKYCGINIPNMILAPFPSIKINSIFVNIQSNVLLHYINSFLFLHTFLLITMTYTAKNQKK